MFPINATWIKVDKSREAAIIIGFSSSTVSLPNGHSPKDSGPMPIRPVAVIMVEGEDRLRYVDFKYLELTSSDVRSALARSETVRT